MITISFFRTSTHFSVSRIEFSSAFVLRLNIYFPISNNKIDNKLELFKTEIRNYKMYGNT